MHQHIPYAVYITSHQIKINKFSSQNQIRNRSLRGCPFGIPLRRRSLLTASLKCLGCNGPTSPCISITSKAEIGGY